MMWSNQGYSLVVPRVLPLEDKQTHYVFLVHGISGNKDTFGALPEVLAEHMQQILPNVLVKVIPIKYETGDPRLTTYDFAHKIGDQILHETKSMKTQDKISLVAHSQGGLITWIWYILSTSQEHTFEKYFPLTQKIDSLLTLAEARLGSGSKLETATACQLKSSCPIWS